jgi:hypothetical protein
MPAFIVCSLALSFLVQNESPYMAWLTSPAALAIGLIAAVASLAGAVLKKMPSAVWYDLFAVGTLLTWFAYWHQQFSNEAPMFYFFPLYYALLTSVIALLFVNRAERFDYESVEQLRYWEKQARFDTPAVVAFVLVSIVITRHYLLYPIAMTLYVMRYMLTRCLEVTGK